MTLELHHHLVMVACLCVGAMGAMIMTDASLPHRERLAVAWFLFWAMPLAVFLVRLWLGAFNCE